MKRQFLIAGGTAGGSTMQQLDWVELARFTDTTQELSFTLPEPYDRFALFLVGGGAGGAADNNKARQAGNGGNGGQVQSFTFNKTTDSNTLTLRIGAGGQGGQSNKSVGNKGGDTTATYNNRTFTALGGLQTPNTDNSTNNSQLSDPPYQAIGGTYIGAAKHFNNQTIYRSTHKASDDKYPGSLTNNTMGDDGFANPFDPADTNLYGAGGGGGFSAYDNHDTDKDAIPGGTTGGGNGGYGDNKATTNHGQDGQFYGAGGGGAAFSENHIYSIGGNGYNGIAILYGKAPKPKTFILQDNI